MPSAARRPVLLLALLLGALVCGASAARADEVFVLDNGMVLRGTAMNENEKVVVLRLTDFPDDARITVELSRIVTRRPGNVGKPVVPAPSLLSRATDVPYGDPGTVPRLTGPGWNPTHVQLAPLEEAAPQHESFTERLRRVALMAMPEDVLGRSVIAVLFFVALLALVGLGGRLLEIEGLNFLRSAVLAGLLGALILADFFYRDVLLRADAALWVVPAQALSWLALTFALVRCGVGKSVLLLAFMLFSLAVVTFTAGGVLVAF
jgi:hypothetical protein